MWFRWLSPHYGSPPGLLSAQRQGCCKPISLPRHKRKTRRHLTALKLSRSPFPKTAVLLNQSPTLSPKTSAPDLSAPQHTRTSESNAGPVVKIHIVEKGQTLSDIAYKYYGSANKWQKIFEANRSRLKDANTLIPGMRLTIPD